MATKSIKQVKKEMEQLGKNSNNSFAQNSLAIINKQQTVIKNDNGQLYISKYTPDVLTDECILMATSKIKATFPALPIEFYNVLIDRVKEKGFSKQRLIDAVNHVIDTCQYPTPTASNFLNFDKKKFILNYQQMLEKINEGDKFENYNKLIINNITYWESKL